MSRFGFMVDRAMNPAKLSILVDLGPNGPDAVAIWQALRDAGIGPRNFSIEGHGRLLMRLPRRKAGAILSSFPIIEGGTYWQTTHHWLGLGNGETQHEQEGRS